MFASERHINIDALMAGNDLIRIDLPLVVGPLYEVANMVEDRAAASASEERGLLHDGKGFSIVLIQPHQPQIRDGVSGFHAWYSGKWSTVVVGKTSPNHTW